MYYFITSLLIFFLSYPAATVILSANNTETVNIDGLSAFQFSVNARGHARDISLACIHSLEISVSS